MDKKRENPDYKSTENTIITESKAGTEEKAKEANKETIKSDITKSDKINDHVVKKEEIVIREEAGVISWKTLYRVGVAVFATFTCCILLFFIVFRFQGVAKICNKLLKASSSILVGLMLAFILNPIMKFFDGKAQEKLTVKYEGNPDKAAKLSRVFAITVTTLMFLAVLVLLGVAVIPSVIKSVMHLVNSMPGYANTIIDFIENGQFGDSPISIMAQNLITQGADYLENWFKNDILTQAQNYITQITNGVISVIKGILNFIIGIIVMDYVMAIQGTLSGQVKKVIYAVFKPETGNTIVHMVRKSSDIFGGFITGKIIDSAIIAVISYIGCSILNIPDKVLVTLIIGVTNVIPFFGPFIGAVPSLLLVVVQSPWHALYLLIFIIVLQQVDGNIIGPKILGSSTGLSSFWIMVAILIGGGMFGLAGMIFGVPFLALLYYIFKLVVAKRLSGKKLPTGTKVYTSLNYVDTEKNEIVSKKR